MYAGFDANYCPSCPGQPKAHFGQPLSVCQLPEWATTFFQYFLKLCSLSNHENASGQPHFLMRLPERATNFKS